MKKRLFLTLAIISVVVLSLVGCTGDDNGGAAVTPLTTLQSKVAALENKIATIEGQLINMPATVPNLTVIQTDLGVLKSDVATLKAQVAGLQQPSGNWASVQSVNALSDSVSSISGSVASVSALVDNLDVENDGLAEDIIANFALIGQISADFVALEARLEGIAAAVATLVTGLSGLEAGLADLEVIVANIEVPPAQDVTLPYVTIEKFRSGSLELKVHGAGNFVAIITLYGTNLAIDGAGVTDAEIEKELLFGREIAEGYPIEGYHIVPDSVETEEAYSHTHLVDLSGIEVFTPIYYLGDTGTMLVIFVVPDWGDWEDGDLFEIDFGAMLVDYAIVGAGFTR